MTAPTYDDKNYYHNDTSQFENNAFSIQKIMKKQGRTRYQNGNTPKRSKGTMKNPFPVKSGWSFIHQGRSVK